MEVYMRRSPLNTTSRIVRALLVGLALAMASIAPTTAAASTASLSPQVALDWNLNAVTPVRAARTMDGVPAGPPRAFYQPEGLLYMGYVQAAVYDAVMKISGRY